MIYLYIMADKRDVLEHEILKTIYDKTASMIGGQPAPQGEWIPMIKRDYMVSHLHFGTLVDALNNPKKYDGQSSLQSLIVRYKDIVTKKYNWEEVNAAIDVLSSNEYVEDNIKLNNYSQPVERKIRITKKGCVAYKTNYYFRTKEKEELDIRQTQSVITTNKLTRLNIGITILFALIVTSVQILSYNREKLRDNRAESLIISDSLRQERELRNDSLFERLILQNANENFHGKDAKIVNEKSSSSKSN